MPVLDACARCVYSLINDLQAGVDALRTDALRTDPLRIRRTRRVVDDDRGIVFERPICVPASMPMRMPMDEPAAAEDTKMPILVLSPVRGSDNTTSASQDAMERADPHSLSPQGGASRGPSASSPLATTEKVRAPHPATETIEPGSEKAVSDVRRALFRLGLVINPAV